MRVTHGNALLYVWTEEFNAEMTGDLGRSSQLGGMQAWDFMYAGVRIRQNHLTYESIIDQEEQAKQVGRIEIDVERRIRIQEEVTKKEGRDKRGATEELEQLGWGMRPDLLHVQRRTRRESETSK